jgi:hypothetical protein
MRCSKPRRTRARTAAVVASFSGRRTGCCTTLDRPGTRRTLPSLQHVPSPRVSARAVGAVVVEIPPGPAAPGAGQNDSRAVFSLPRRRRAQPPRLALSFRVDALSLHTWSNGHRNAGAVVAGPGAARRAAGSAVGAVVLEVDALVVAPHLAVVAERLAESAVATGAVAAYAVATAAIVVVVLDVRALRAAEQVPWGAQRLATPVRAALAVPADVSARSAVVRVIEVVDAGLPAPQAVGNVRVRWATALRVKRDGHRDGYGAGVRVGVGDASRTCPSRSR